MQLRPHVTLVSTAMDLQAAVDATPAGGTLYLGDGTYTVPSGGLIISHSIAIEGVSQPSDFDTTYSNATRLRMGTVIRAYSANAASQPIIVINPGAAYSGQSQLSFKLKNVVLDGRATGYHAGSYGIYSLREDGEKLETCELDNVVVINTGDTGIHLARNVVDATTDSAIVGFYARRVFCHSCYGRGMYVYDATLASIRDSIFMLNRLTGLYLDGVGCDLSNVAAESNGSAQDGSLTVYEQAQIYAVNCNHFSTIGHHVENFDGATRSTATYFSRIGIYVNACTAVQIGSGFFYNTPYDGAPGGYNEGAPGNNWGGDLWRNYANNQDGTLSGGDESTNVALKVFECRNFNIATQRLLHCYNGITVVRAGAGPYYHYIPGAIANPDVYDYSGYGCAKPMQGISGTRLPAMDPTYAEALDPEPAGVIAETGGIMYWDTTNHRLRLWNGSAWSTIT